jgi:RNA recognition motif-containing protein
MNPLTLVKRIQKINSREADLNISEEASWHTKYKDSAYVFVGGIPFDLTEGDLLAVFAQYVIFSCIFYFVYVNMICVLNLKMRNLFGFGDTQMWGGC